VWWTDWKDSIKPELGAAHNQPPETARFNPDSFAFDGALIPFAGYLQLLNWDRSHALARQL
jgi:hypothetical protein